MVCVIKYIYIYVKDFDYVCRQIALYTHNYQDIILKPT